MFIIFAIILITLLYFLDRKLLSYWQSLGIPQQWQLVLLGSIKDLVLQRIPIAEFYSIQCKKFPSEPIVGIYFSYRPVVVVNDLELSKTILTKDFHYFHDRGAFIDPVIDPLTENLFLLPGEKWKKLRQKLTPLFSASKLKMMLPIIRDSVVTLDDFIERKLTENNSFITDIRDLSSKFTFTMISSVAFGIQNDCINEPNNQFRLTSLKVLDPNFTNNMRILAAIFLPKICEIFKLKMFDKEVSNFFIDITKQTINYRKEHNIHRNDFLQLFMQLKDDGIISGEEFTMNEVAANLFLFVIAGYETTSMTITYCMYEIAKNPAVMLKVQQEINELKDEQFSYEKLNNLKYLDNCVMEALRKYPSVPVLIRECQNDYKVSGTPYVIPKGTQTVVPVFSMQRDPELYPNPLEFSPDRYNSKNVKTNLTFGYGNRSCIGSRMAMIVVKTCLLGLLEKYHVELISPMKEIEFSTKIPSLTPTGPIMVKFSKRQKSLN